MYQPAPVCVSRGWILAWVRGYSIQPIQRPEDPIPCSDGLGGAFQSLGTGPTVLGGRTCSEVPARPTLWPLGRAHLKEMREKERRNEEGKLGTATVGLPLLRGSLPCNYNQDYFIYISYKSPKLRGASWPLYLESLPDQISMAQIGLDLIRSNLAIGPSLF